MSKPVNVPATRRGIDCGECGLPGLGVREITVALWDGADRRTVRTQALSCCYCHTAVALGDMPRLRVDVYPPRGVKSWTQEQPIRENQT